MARQMWVSLRFITVTHDAAHLTRSHGRKKKECLFDSGSSFVLCVKKKKKVLKFMIKGEARSLKERH